jgi:hypothetical protein
MLKFKTKKKSNDMKTKNWILTALCTTGILVSTLQMMAQEKPAVQIKPYTLDACIVSGQKLDTMCNPYVFTNGTHEIKLCCKGCLGKFNQDSAGYIKKIEEAGKQTAHSTSGETSSATTQPHCH